MTTDELFTRLAEPFDPERISWRVGSTNADKTKGMALAYIDARDVMDRLDLVCGPAGWERRHPHVDKTTTCEIAIWIEGRGWIVKSDGAGDTQVEAEKGSLSDAFKRAAVNWGIGRYLYELPSPWVKIVGAGRSYKIDDGEFGKLKSLLRAHTGQPRKSAAQANRDGDLIILQEKIDAAADLEDLGAVGREIKLALPSLPVAWREPLQDRYLARREELITELGAAA